MPFASSWRRAALAAPVEQQAAATREIVASVQTVTTATQESTQAMQESTDAASGMVTAGAMRSLRDADTMRIAGDMSEGNGVPAVLQPRGGSEVRAATVDIARSGLSCRCDWRATAGTEVPIELPEAGGPVIARIVRPEGGVLALVLPSGRGDAASSGLGTSGSFP